MATVYSLVCFGGFSGKTVTFTDAGDVVNLTNHGLRQGVTGIVFSTTGSLPTGITAGTTYYPRDGADANKFTIYPTKADALAGTNQVTFTGTGSGTHTVKSAYLLGLTSTQLARYGSSGSERIYDGLVAWHTARSAATDMYTDEVCEIGDAYSDIMTATMLSATIPSAATLITSKINGQRSAAFHGGVPGSGYVFVSSVGSDTLLNVTAWDFVIDGIELHAKSSGKATLVLNQVGCGAKRCILHGLSAAATANVVRFMRPVVFLENCLVYHGYRGILIDDYGNTRGAKLHNNLFTQCATGVHASGSSSAVFAHNNISFGNTTNWSAIPSTGIHAAFNNAGESGNSPWDTGTSTAITTITSGSFVNTSTFDFRPASSSAPQVNAGIEVYGIEAIDLGDDVRPNYQPSVYPDEVWDIGPFEYDNGNGLAPQQVTLSISGMAEGSVMAVYKISDGTAIISPTTIGASGSHSTTYSYTGNVQIEVVVRKGSSGTKYLPYSAPGLITSTGFSLIVNQVADGVLNG